jgi:hypothetical protein
MPLEPLPFDLNDTISATWRRRLAGPDGARVHWKTKTTYYKAVARLLRERPGTMLSWRDVIEAAIPQGSRSTFYEVTGPRSKHALIDRFLDPNQPSSLQLALVFRRPSAVEQLIDEAKVWSYWPYRDRWMSACYAAPELTLSQASDAMIAGLTVWARREPALAAALDYAPPVCAAEDLIRLHRGPLPAIRAVAVLRQGMRSAAGPEAEGDPAFGPAAAIAG